MSSLHLLLPAAALLLAGAAPYSVQLDARGCRPLPRQKILALGPEWQGLARFVQRCPVHGPDGRLALSVDAVRVDRALATDFFRAHPTTYPVPRPILRDAAGRIVGALPEAFPEEPPGRLRIRFTDWRRGIPHEIRLYQAGESALPPHPMPSLRWDSEAGHYR